ncbi:hypothetical protein Pint_31083 [Pistacia integerrima]|uniref:Uncharacterized protein n=1 Tax=Pistacia integerrima TaxID=434235 RepID=A0ACC0XTF2_9ROSI|nr:hypothetical protein Pint_31083 [Pistacia integerrima]
MNVRPNCVTLVSVLSACCGLRSLKLGKAVHGYSLRNVDGFNIVFGNAMLDFYLRCGSILAAEYLFVKMPERDVVSWSTLIGGYAQRGFCEEAIRVFKEMVKTKEAEPNEATIVNALSAFLPQLQTQQNNSNVSLEAHHLSCCMPHQKGLKIAVLVSGGVDSSVALRLLHAAGHSCTAFYLKIWFQEDFENFWSECPWEEDLKYARAVCDQVDVPLEVVHLTDEYWKNVVSYIIEEYRCGRTPNPDVLCNTRIKFGAFMDAINSLEFDYVASGHYANVVHSAADQMDELSVLELSKDMVAILDTLLSYLKSSYMRKKFCLDMKTLKAPEVPQPLVEPLWLTQQPVFLFGYMPSSKLIHADERLQVKDQTYFLSHLSQAQLKRLIFPLGLIPKDEVRKLATRFDLPNKDRKDSQGICFLGKIKFSEFVARHIGEMEGVMLEAETGDFLGKHRGFWFYTIGQRQGLRLPGGPWYAHALSAVMSIFRTFDEFIYSESEMHLVNFSLSRRSFQYVVEKDVKNNVVFVSRNYFSFDKKRRLFRVGSLRWHGPGFYNCSLTIEQSEGGHGDVAVVHLSEDDQGLAAGQFAAFYQGRKCLGSGIILESWDDQGFPVCEKALEIARMEDKSRLGKPVKIKVKPETPTKKASDHESLGINGNDFDAQNVVAEKRKEGSDSEEESMARLPMSWLQKLRDRLPKLL